MKNRSSIRISRTPSPRSIKRTLSEIGVKDINELYEEIPPELRLKRDLNLPESPLSELELRRRVEAVLDQNISCAERPSFLGAGCARDYVPAICDEIAHRSEFLTAYAGEPYEDAGRFQALFEYESLMAELLDFDVVNVPTCDWGQAASTAARPRRQEEVERTAARGVRFIRSAT